MSTSILYCSSGSGAISGKRSTSVAVVGHPLHVGMRPVGAPQHRSGAASTSARANGTASVNGGPFDETRSAPQIFTQAFSFFKKPNSVLKGGCSNPSAALTRPMWSMTNGTGSLLEHSSSSTRSCASRCRIRCQPRDLQLLDCLLEETHVGPAAEVAHEVEAHRADAALVHPLEVLFGKRIVDDRRAAIAPAGARDRIERDAHVGAVAARVDDDSSLKTQTGDAIPAILQMAHRLERRPPSGHTETSLPARTHDSARRRQAAAG